MDGMSSIFSIKGDARRICSVLFCLFHREIKSSSPDQHPICKAQASLFDLYSIVNQIQFPIKAKSNLRTLKMNYFININYVFGYFQNG